MLYDVRKKAQRINAQNKNLHILSHGAYRKLEERILKEKQKSRPHLLRMMLFNLLHHHCIMKSGN